MAVDDEDDGSSHADEPKPFTFPPQSAASALLAAGTPPHLDEPDADEEPHEDPSFLFFQLPTTLPLKPGVDLARGDLDRYVMNGDEYLAALAGSSPSSSGCTGGGAGGEKPEAGAPPPVELSDLGSGQLGELIVRKSGKVELLIGPLSLEVQPGTICSTDQEIVTMGMPAAPGGTVELHRLGKMRERMVVTPNLDHLLGSNGV